MTSKIALGNDFVLRLIELDVVPEHCIHVIIDARVDELPTIHYEVIGNEDQLQLVAAEAYHAFVRREG